MQVKVKDLQAGCILTEDVYSITNRPIIPKQTILTDELIAVLNAFLISSVEIGNVLVNGTPFICEGDTVGNGEGADFTSAFLQAVQESKEEFKLWQSGIPVNITRIRQILMPLLEKMESNPGMIFPLHRLSNEEEYFYQHMAAVGLISAFIAAKQNYSKGEIVQAGLAGFLADCGMSKVEQAILQKKSTLTAKEYEEIKHHVSFSYNMVKNIPFLNEGAKLAVIQHHERMDGSGYIFGLKGKKIHPMAKIVAVADTFHAMTSERLYRSKQSPFKVIELIKQNYFGKFDLETVKSLENGMVHLSKGSLVKLSNGETGEILAVNKHLPMRPLVQILESGHILNMLDDKSLFIEEMIENTPSICKVP